MKCPNCNNTGEVVVINPMGNGDEQRKIAQCNYCPPYYIDSDIDKELKQVKDVMKQRPVMPSSEGD